MSKSLRQVLWAFGFAGLGSLRSKKIDPLFSKREGRVDTTLTMRSKRQLVATDGKSFRLVEPFFGGSDLRPVATDCNHGAP